jgi:hypothetical protein
MLFLRRAERYGEVATRALKALEVCGIADRRDAIAGQLS